MKGFVRGVNFLNDVLEYIESFLIFLFIFLMVLVAFGQVVLRMIFHIGFTWADDLLRHLVLWSGFVGASIATRHNRHINIDVLSRFLEARVKKFSDSVILLFSAIISTFLGIAGVEFVKMEREFQEMSVTLHLPLWILQLVIPVSFFIIALRFFVNSIGSFWEGVKGGAD